MMKSSFRLFLFALLFAGLGACAGRSPDENSPAAGMLNLAQQLQKRGDLAGASDSYQKALQADPKNLTAQKELGSLAEHFGNFEEAEKYYTAALDQEPHDANLRRNYGRVLIGLGRPTDAIDQYKKALKYGNSDDPRALNGLGVAFDALGEHDKAQEKFLEALEADERNANTVNNLAYSYILSGKYDEAIKYLEPFAPTKQATPAMRQNLALAYGLSGMTVDAERLAKMDLSAEQVKANLAAYNAKRAKLHPEENVCVQIGPYATRALAEVDLTKIKELEPSVAQELAVASEILSSGGTPRFIIRITGAKCRDTEKLCEKLSKSEMSCLIKPLAPPPPEKTEKPAKKQSSDAHQSNKLFSYTQRSLQTNLTQVDYSFRAETKMPCATIGDYQDRAAADTDLAKVRELYPAFAQSLVVTSEPLSPGGAPRFLIDIPRPLCDSENVGDICRNLALKNNIPCRMRKF